MKRPRLILALAFLQLVLGVIYMSFAIYIIHQTTTPEIMNDSDAPDTIKGLLIGAALFGAMGFGTLVSSFGLWLVESWGRWLAIAMNGIAAGVMVYNAFDESHLDWQDVAIPVALVLALVPYLFPTVGRALNGPKNTGTAPAAGPS